LPRDYMDYTKGTAEMHDHSFVQDKYKYMSSFSHYSRYVNRPHYDPKCGLPDSSTTSLVGADAILGSMDTSYGTEQNYGIGTCEILKVFIKLNPADFGLESKSDAGKKAQSDSIQRFETWYFEIINDTFIVYGTPLDASYGRLPVSIASLSIRDTESIDKSVSESLIPFQDIASTLFNQHLKANRRSVNGGNTFYDSTAIDINKVKDPSLAWIPVDMNEHDTPDIRKHITQFADIPNNSRLMQDVQSIYDIVDNGLPTNAAKRIGDLQRATEYQAQTAYFESNKRIGLFARLIDNRALSDVRLIMFNNELLNREVFKGIDEKGKPVEFPATEMLSVKTTFSNGLRAIDKFSISSMYEKILNFTIQAKLQERGVDVLKLVDHWASMNGDATDLSRFQVENPIDSLPEDQKNLAMQLLQQYAQQQQAGAEGGGQPQQPQNPQQGVQ